MVEVVNRSQQVTKSGLNPKSSYSRLVCLDVAPLAAGPTVYAYTPAYGQNIWLLGIWIQHMPRAASIVDFTSVLLVAGSGVPTNVADLYGWEHVLGIVQLEGIPPGLRVYDGLNALSWSMSRLFKGQSRRFAIIANRTGAGNDLVQVQIEISEG